MGGPPSLEIQGRGEATAARLTLSIDEGWSVQHLNSGTYVLQMISRCNTSVLEYMLSLRIPISQKPKLERRFLGGHEITRVMKQRARRFGWIANNVFWI